MVETFRFECLCQILHYMQNHYEVLLNFLLLFFLLFIDSTFFFFLIYNLKKRKIFLITMSCMAVQVQYVLDDSSLVGCSLEGCSLDRCFNSLVFAKLPQEKMDAQATLIFCFTGCLSIQCFGSPLTQSVKPPTVI